MPPLVIAAVIAAAGATGGAAISARSAGNAAKRQSESANHAADVEAASARETLDFTKQEAQQKAEQAEADRRANYDQWAAQMNAHNAARARYGYATSTIPGYVPGKVPSYTNSPGAALMGQGGPPRPPMSAQEINDTGIRIIPGETINGRTGAVWQGPDVRLRELGTTQPSVGELLMPPIGGTPYTLARDPRVQINPSRGLPARPAPRSIGASLYGGR